MSAPRQPVSDQDLDAALRGWAAAQRASVDPPPRPLLGSPRDLRPAPPRRWAVPLTAAATVVLLAIALAAAPRLLRPDEAPEASQVAVPVEKSQDARPWVHDAAVTRSLTLDGGALRLDPPADRNSADGVDVGFTTEQQALALWRSGPAGLVGGTIDVADVVVARARITLTVPVDPPGRSALRPTRPPGFSSRAGWVVLSSPGTYHCPSAPTARAQAQGVLSIPIWLLAGNGTEAVDYTTAGVGPCGQVAAAPAATTSASNHELIVDAGPLGPTDLTACADSGNSVTINGRPETALVTLLATGPCSGGGLPGGWHAGPLLVGRTTGTSGLAYFDGAERRLP